MTPNDVEYTDKFNTWLRSIPQYLKEIVFVVKRHYSQGWGGAWRERFSVDIVNGNPGNELKCDNLKLAASYLRIGYDEDGAWRVFGLREDFHPAAKVQMEDDITASVVVPGGFAGAVAGGGDGALDGALDGGLVPSLKFVGNCELKLFQRPDDAVIRGYDKVTEHDLSQPGNFISNFQPLDQHDAQALTDEAISFSKYSAPMQQLVRIAAAGEPGPAFFVSSAHPRMVDGKPSKNPRYLQIRPDLADARSVHLAQMATRLHRRLDADAPLLTPVDAVVPGRRNNPPDAQEHIRSLAVYNPIHYMELPELFMEFISSMTGKSPSTTGAGSEGALTKGPFNALPAIIDLNASLVGHILTAKPSFLSAAGHVGPNVRVDHDVSLLVPEVWSRMTAEEREPAFLIQHGYLEKCDDFTFDGRTVEASRLGYRITAKFGRVFFGRVFTHPHSIFTAEMLRPEIQDRAVFADGMDNVCETHQRVAQSYLDDGTISMACPPLRALLHVMATGSYEGSDAAIARGFARCSRCRRCGRATGTAERLVAKQQADVVLWTQHVAGLETFIADDANKDDVVELGLEARLSAAVASVARVGSAAYLESLRGTLGRQPL